jgi:hypothetical protein
MTEENEAVLDDDWDDVDLEDVDLEDVEDDGDEAEADQPDAAEADEDTVEEESQEEPAKADQPELFDLKFMGELKQVDKDEVVVLAQKGLNHDHMREERDAAIAEKNKFTPYEEFLQELAADRGVSIDELIDATRAQTLAQKEGIDESVALGRVKLQRQEKALQSEREALKRQKEQKSQEDEAEAKRQEDFLAFAKEYPDVQPKDIPQEVWLDVQAGKSLLDAYTKHENKRLKAELETAKLNLKNKGRSTGSRSTAGQTKNDKWFDGWDDD